MFSLCPVAVPCTAQLSHFRLPKQEAGQPAPARSQVKAFSAAQSFVARQGDAGKRSPQGPLNEYLPSCTTHKSQNDFKVCPNKRTPPFGALWPALVQAAKILSAQLYKTEGCHRSVWERVRPPPSGEGAGVGAVRPVGP